ncbi:MAG: RIP metalloprotease [Chloroflexi bacterium]|nr:RIP metalloprotease [Chloroflexota bacterium]
MTVLTDLAQSAITLVVFVLILGVLVIVHELGHFAMARIARVRVLEFGIGFPPRARVLRSHGETLYTLNWLPLGGFVKLEGEEGGSDDPHSFSRAGLPLKLVILVAGVAMNVLLAVAIFTTIGWLPGQTGALGFRVVQTGSPAALAGLQGTGASSDPAAGDRVVSVDGQSFHDFDGGGRMIDLLRSRAGHTVTLGVLHPSGTTDTIVVKLRSPAALDATHGPLGISGATFTALATPFTRSPADALAFGLARTGEAFGLIASGLGQLGDAIVNRPTQAPPVQGPVGIAVGVGDVFWQQGPIATLYLAGLLSANLALVNILPLPPLDGGRMLVLALKAIVGKRLSLQIERLTYLVGFGVLMAFLAWITFFDIARQIGGGG